MVAPAVIAGIGQGVAGIISGNKARGEARVVRRVVDQRMVEAINYAKQKNAEAAGMGAYDFQKLRDDAIKAGLNPLTVLQATGGAGYDQQSLASPFGNVADLMVRRAEMLAGTSSAVIDRAGYFGEAVGAGFGAYFDQLNADRAAALDAARTAAISSVGKPATNAGGGYLPGPFASGQVVQATGESLSYPADWWKGPLEKVQIATQDVFQRFSGFGQTTVLPAGGPDAESVLSGMWIEATNKAKAKGYIAPDAERPVMDYLTDLGAEMYRVGGWGLDYLTKVGALPYWK